MTEAIVLLFKQSFVIGIAATSTAAFGYLLFKSITEYKKSIDGSLHKFDNHLHEASKELKKHSDKLENINSGLSLEVINVKRMVADIKVEMAEFIKTTKEMDAKSDSVIRIIKDVEQNYGKVIILEKRLKRQEEVEVKNLDLITKAAQVLKLHKEELECLKNKK